MFTPEQVRRYRSLEEQYPEHLAPRKGADDDGLVAIYFVVADVTDEVDCGGACGRVHESYVVIIPNGEVIGGMFSETIISGTFGESLVLPKGLQLNGGRAVAVDAEDWPVQSEAVEADPWFGLDF